MKTLLRQSIRSRRAYNLLRRAYLLWIKLSKQPHEADFAFFRFLERRSRGVFVDVGANGGQSAVSFSCFNKNFDIVAFEPNATLEPELRFVRRLLGSRFSYHLFGLGERDGEFDLHIPFAGSLPIDARASLNQENLTDFMESIAGQYGRAATVRTRRAVIRVFDDLGMEPDIVKIDVEGLEDSVLRGMTTTIEKCRPIFLIENARSFRECENILSSFSYRLFVFDADNQKLTEIADTPGSINFFALPPGILDELPAGVVDLHRPKNDGCAGEVEVSTCRLGASGAP